jgi:signal transduction histidine kinase
MLGYSLESDFLGKSLHDILYCADRGADDSIQAECRVMAAIVKGEEYFNPDEQLICSDGSMITASYRACPLFREDGALCGAVVTFVDITKQKVLEEQLRQSQKIEAIGTLAGGVAHDFNNILTAIIGFGTLMEMKMAEDDPLMRNLQQILAAADRAADLTRSLLAFNRKQFTDMRSASLNKIVQGLEKMVSRLLRENIRLTVDLCQEETPILADASQIEQVLLNLTANAGEAMLKGGEIQISTSICMLDEDFTKRNGLAAAGAYVMLTFSDNGSGMDEATAARVFHPFVNDKKDGEGSGLGLPVCYGIIRKHNGYIECQSEKGAGTVFKIYLPELSAARNGFVRGASSMDHLKGDETVLLAEDDPGVRALNRRILEKFGYNVIEASEGDEALQLYTQNRQAISLSILDVIMPNKGAVEVYHGIRSFDSVAPIIFISGYSEDFLKKLDLPAGIKVVRKPAPPARFLETVRGELNKYSELKKQGVKNE